MRGIQTKRLSQTSDCVNSRSSPREKRPSDIDVAMVSLKYAAERSRASVIVQYGDVTNGWGNGATASPNDLFGRYVQEAYAGFMLANNL